MSVPVGLRSKGTLEVFVKADELAIYTNKLCSNKKRFAATHYKLAEDMIWISWQITEYLTFARCAPHYNQDRLEYLDAAILLCQVLLHDIELAGKLLTQRIPDILFWSNKVDEVLSLIHEYKNSSC